MGITLHASFLPPDDPDASPAFYRDTLGFEVRDDVGYDVPLEVLLEAGKIEPGDTHGSRERGPAQQRETR